MTHVGAEVISSDQADRHPQFKQGLCDRLHAAIGDLFASAYSNSESPHPSLHSALGHVAAGRHTATLRWRRDHFN